MDARKAAAGRCASAAKILVAACSFAGCTGGPAVTSVSTETPTALVQPDDKTQVAQVSAGHAHVADRSAAAIARPARPAAISRTSPVLAAAASRTKPARVATTPRTAPALTDPFLARRDVVRSRAVSANVARRSPAAVQRVSHFEPAAACASPVTATSARPTREPAGIARVQDHRLPPAAPLGAANPFNRSTATAERTTLAAAPGSRQTTAKPETVSVEAAVSQTRLASQREETPITIDAFLAGRRTIGNSPAPSIRHHDMIVDSAILPKRIEWRSEILPQQPEPDQSLFPITPRRPFAAPDWNDAGRASSATANVPVAISPEETRPPGRIDLSTSTPTIGQAPAPQADLIADETATTPGDFSKDPFGAIEPQITPDLAAAFADEQPSFAAAPLLAPAPPSLEPEMAGDTLSEAASEPGIGAGPALTIATAVTDKLPTRPTEGSSEMIVRPLDLHDANREAQETAESNDAVTAPVAIGLALAAVAIGAVLIRRRFA